MRPQWRGRGLTRNANRGARRRATLARCTAFAGVRGGTSHAKRGPAPPTRPPRAARGAKPWRNSSRDAPGQSERREPTGARGLADGRPQAGRSADCGPAIPQLGGRGQRARVRAWDDRRPSERRRRVRLISHRARPCRYLPSLPGARKTELTGYIEPCDPTLRDQAPRGDDWVYEIKADGYRAQVHLSGGRVTVYSRRGLDWTRQFSAIADAAALLPVETCILDGEAVVYGASGRPDFQALRREIGTRRSDRLRYLAFDLLALDGYDLRQVP